ncbi:MAG: hypothetical protein JKY95_02150 [Planctomycetaceae bacterium]|nr:hypothetical protein [Planctomycetaceae bacterium]
MADRQYSQHQKKVIQRYYDNREQIDEQRLAELVTSLFLATPKQAIKRWESAEDLMRRLGVPESRIENIMKRKDPAILATVVDDLQKGLITKKKQ